MKQILDKQKVQGTNALGGSGTSRLESLSREGNVVYVDFANKQIIELQKLNKTIGEGLGDKGELSKQLKKLKTTLDSGSKPGAITQKVMGMAQTGKPGDIAPPTGLKDFFTLRGFLDKTNILKRGHSDTAVGRGIDKMLGNREQKGLQADAEKKDYAERKQQYVKDRIATKGSTFGDEKSFGKTFDKSEKIQKEILKNEEEVKGLKDRGFKEGQIKRGGFYAKNQTLEKELAKIDPRFSESFGGVDSKSADPNKPKITKAADDTDRNSTKKKSADIKPIKVESTDSKIKADPNKPKVVKAANNDDPNSTVIRSTDVKKVKAEKIADAELPANVLKFPGKTKESSGLGAADMTEADVENQRMMQEQTDLLKTIAENTGGKIKKDALSPNKEQPKSEGGGLLDDIMGMFKGGIMKAIKFIFNPKNLLKALTKIALPALIIGSLVNGIMDGFKAFMETGSIAEALIAGFGGILSFLSFGLFDAKTVRSVVDWFGSFVTDYVIQPLKDFFGFLGQSFDKYIAQPIMEAFEFIGDMLTEYIVEPVKKFFAPIADFFKNIKDQVFGFLEDFGIPEIGFTIPIIGKKVSIGPFYPFRPGEGTDKVYAKSEVKESSSRAGDGQYDESNLKENFGVTNKKETTVINSEAKDSVDKDGKVTSKYSETMATFDPKTGKASYINQDDPNNEKYDAPLTKGGFNQIKKASKEGAGSDKIKEIIKEDEAYQKLGFFDKMKVDTGFAKATDLAKLKPADEPQTGNQVAAASADSEMAKTVQPSQSSTVIAPTSNVNNSSSTTYAMKPRVRNPDEGVRRQLAQRYGT